MPRDTRAHVVVSGVVQGVGYRLFAVGEARERGLTGWSRNRADGSVEVVVEGERGLVEEFIGRLQVGPPASRVTKLEVNQESYTGEFDSFRVRHG